MTDSFTSSAGIASYDRYRDTSSRGNIQAEQTISDGLTVTAFVVTDGTAKILPEVLAAVAAQSRPVDKLIVVDVSEHSDVERQPERVLAHMRNAEIIAAMSARTLGAAVRIAVAATAMPAEHDQWLWVLHDDSIPQPDTLVNLVEAAELNPSVGVVGCKQLDGSGQRLIEVGVTTSRFGRRMTQLDDDEVDQGQHDQQSDVLAVGTAGMMVRADVWLALGGPDPFLGPFEDGIDLSVRAHLAGHRVIVVPQARVRHYRRSYYGLTANESEPDSSRSFRSRRVALLHRQAASAPFVTTPFLALFFILASIVRALGRLTAKEPSLMRDELVAPWIVFLAPRRLARSRMIAKRTRQVPRRTLAPLYTTWRAVTQQWWDRRLARRELKGRKRLPNEIELAHRARINRRRHFGLALLVVMLVALTIVRFGSIIIGAISGRGVHGGGLLPTSATSGQLWEIVTTQWIPRDLGDGAPADGIFQVLAGFALIFGGNVQLAINVILLSSVFVAGLGAWFAAGALTRSVVARLWCAIVWVLSPSFMLAAGDGRLGALIAIMTLPWIALLIARAVGTRSTDPGSPVRIDGKGRPLGSIAAAAGAGILGAVAASGATAIVVVLLAVAVVLIPVSRGRRGRLLLMVIPALVTSFPMVRAAFDNPRILFATSGVPSESGPISAWELLLGLPERIGAWPEPFGLSATIGAVALGATVALLAIVAIGRVRDKRVSVTVRVGLVVAAIGVCLAAATATTVVADGAGGTARGWPGVGTAIVTAGLLIASVVGAERLGPWLSSRSFGWRQLTTGIVGAIAVIVPFGTCASWIVMDNSALMITLQFAVPAVAAEQQMSPEKTRILVVSQDDAGTVHADLLRFAGADLRELSTVLDALPLSGSTDAPRAAKPDEGRTEIDTVAANLVFGNGQVPTAELASIGAGAVLVPNSGDPAVRESLVVQLGTRSGLDKVTENASGDLWRVVTGDDEGTATERVSRVRLVSTTGETIGAVPSEDFTVDAQIPAGDEGRIVVMAERANDRWVATYNGERLESANQGWAQAFQLPASAGELEITYESVGARPWVIVELTVLMLSLLLAIPIRRKRDHVETRYAEDDTDALAYLNEVASPQRSRWRKRKVPADEATETESSSELDGTDRELGDAESSLDDSREPSPEPENVGPAVRRENIDSARKPENSESSPAPTERELESAEPWGDQRETASDERAPSSGEPVSPSDDRELPDNESAVSHSEGNLSEDEPAPRLTRREARRARKVQEQAEAESSDNRDDATGGES